jgi:hypothetical protein
LIVAPHWRPVWLRALLGGPQRRLVVKVIEMVLATGRTARTEILRLPFSTGGHGGVRKLSMTKEEAQREAVRRWRELPVTNQQLENVPEFARLLLPALTFDTLGDRERIIAAWLVRDIEQRNRVLRTIDGKAATHRSDRGD